MWKACQKSTGLQVAQKQVHPPFYDPCSMEAVLRINEQQYMFPLLFFATSAHVQRSHSLPDNVCELLRLN